MQDMHPLVQVVRGDFPVVLSVPHAGKKLPEELKKYAVETTPGDKDADLLAYAIIEEARRSGVDFSSVVALGRRSLLELNWGESRTRGIPELKEYYQAYMGAVGECLKIARGHHGRAVLLDVHGYAESSHKPRPEIGFTPGEIVFGTWNGQLIPEDLHPAFLTFKAQIGKAGFSVHPREGHDEYWRLIGGDIVGRFGGRNGVAAIQMEVPSRIRFDKDLRSKLARAVAKALVEFAKDET